MVPKNKFQIVYQQKTIGWENCDRYWRKYRYIIITDQFIPNYSLVPHLFQQELGKRQQGIWLKEAPEWFWRAETCNEPTRLNVLFVIYISIEITNSNQTGEIVESTGSARVEVMQLDLGSLASVRNFVADFLRDNKKLDVLINNAAAMSLPNKLSSDGLQQEMQINHFGPFLLTILLLGIKLATNLSLQLIQNL